MIRQIAVDVADHELRCSGLFRQKFAITADVAAATGKLFGREGEEFGPARRIVDFAHRVERTVIEREFVQSGGEHPVGGLPDQRIRQLLQLPAGHARLPGPAVNFEQLPGQPEQRRIGRIDEGR